MYCYCYLLLLLLNHLLSNIVVVETSFRDNEFHFNMDRAHGTVKMVKFNNGHLCPMLGMGTWQGKHDLKLSEQTDMYEAVINAIDLGYRHFDCASFYNNEEFVGKAIAEKIDEGIIKREDIFVTSKLWNTKHDPKDVEGELRKSLKSLGLKYLDLYLIHWPFATTDDPIDSEGLCTGANISYVDTWKAMEKCVQLGLTKSIGLANFNITQVKNILKVAKIKPVVNQVENHPYLPQNELKEFCNKNDIIITAYGPLGSPYRKANQKHLLSEYYVKQMAFKYKTSNAQVLIRFQIQRGNIVIPKSTNPFRLKENYEVWDFKMTDLEIFTLASLNQNLRFCLFSSARHLKDYPFDEEPWPKKID